MMVFMMWPTGPVGISGDNYVSPPLCAGRGTIYHCLLYQGTKYYTSVCVSYELRELLLIVLAGYLSEVIPTR